MIGLLLCLIPGVQNKRRIMCGHCFASPIISCISNHNLCTCAFCLCKLCMCHFSAVVMSVLSIFWISLCVSDMLRHPWRLLKNYACAVWRKILNNNGRYLVNFKISKFLAFNCFGVIKKYSKKSINMLWTSVPSFVLIMWVILKWGKAKVVYGRKYEILPLRISLN